MRVQILVGVGALIITTSVAAQEAGSVELSALGLVHGKTSTMDGSSAVGASARLGIWLPAHFEIEGQLDFTRASQVRTATHFTLWYPAASLVYNVPAGTANIYISGGYGKLLPQSCLVLQSYPCPSHGAILFAAGFKVPLSPGIGLRLEGALRTRPEYSYSSAGVSGGIVMTRFRLGTGASGAGRDTDRDGVPDRRDRCANTPLGALVDLRGCPTDTDGDGVFDGIDRCPATPPGTPVNAVGCPVKRPD